MKRFSYVMYLEAGTISETAVHSLVLRFVQCKSDLGVVLFFVVTWEGLNQIQVRKADQ